SRYKQSSTSSSGAGSGLSGGSGTSGARRDQYRDRDHYGKHSFELPRQHSKEEAYHRDRDRDRDRDRESSAGGAERGDRGGIGGNGGGVTGGGVYVDRRTRPRSITNRRGAIKHQ
ncbi:hypothetical protein KR084_005144, partial [Drosophila pseudotakahashii]